MVLCGLAGRGVFFGVYLAAFAGHCLQAIQDKCPGQQFSLVVYSHCEPAFEHELAFYHFRLGGFARLLGAIEAVSFYRSFCLDFLLHRQSAGGVYALRVGRPGQKKISRAGCCAVLFGGFGLGSLAVLQLRCLLPRL